MNKMLPLVLALTLPALAQAEGFDRNRLHAGAGVSYNQIDSPFGGRTESAAGINLFAGYELKTNIRDVQTFVEAGYAETDDFYGKGTDVGGLWVAGVMEKDLPEVGRNIFVLGRMGLDLGDDDGILIGAGGGLHLNKETDLRAEFINKDATSVFQISLVLGF